MHVLAKKSPKTLFGFSNHTWDSLNHKLNFDPASFLACKDGCFLFPSSLVGGGGVIHFSVVNMLAHLLPPFQGGAPFPNTDVASSCTVKMFMLGLQYMLLYG
jgi:hypothetical protein